MDFKTRHLRLVQAVRAEGTLIGAARRLHLSQAAVSQGLRELEGLCGQQRISELQLTEAVLSAVRAGMGLSVLARWAVAPEIDSGRLVARPLTPRGLYRQWSATTLRDAESPRVAEELILALRENSIAGAPAPPPDRDPATEGPAWEGRTRGGAKAGPSLDDGREPLKGPPAGAG